MKTLKVETFFWGAKSYNSLVDFINENGIQKEDILKIVCDQNDRYTLFYYSDTQ